MTVPCIFIVEHGEVRFAPLSCSEFVKILLSTRSNCELRCQVIPKKTKYKIQCHKMMLVVSLLQKWLSSPLPLPHSQTLLSLRSWRTGRWKTLATRLSSRSLASRYSQDTGGPSWRFEDLLFFFFLLRTFSAWNVTYLPPTSSITCPLSLISRNVTLSLQHMEVLCYNDLNLQRFVWVKEIIDITADEILIFLQKRD